jgi:hypothetical protein
LASWTTSSSTRWGQRGSRASTTRPAMPRGRTRAARRPPPPASGSAHSGPERSSICYPATSILTRSTRL